MKTKRYEITGMTEQDIEKWSGQLVEGARIFMVHRGKRKIKIIIELTKLEYISAKFQLLMFNLKHKTKLTIKSYK